MQFTAVGRAVKGAAGNVRTTNTVRLAVVDGGTRVELESDLAMGGVLGSVGQKVVAKQAGQVTKDFSDALERAITGEPAPAEGGLGERRSRPAPSRFPVPRRDGRSASVPLPSPRCWCSGALYGGCEPDDRTKERHMTVTRVGLLVPSSNTTIETEVPDMLYRRSKETGERFTFHSSRAELLQVDKDSLDRMVADADRCVRELSDAHVDVLAYACLVAIMAQGPGAHIEAEERLARGAAENGAPAPVVSSAGALIRGMEALGLRRVAIVTPYKDSLTQLVAEYIENCGITVVDSRSLRVTENVAVGRLDPMNLVDIAGELDTSTADGVVLSACVQMPSLPAIPMAEQALGLPVLSAATATVYEILTALGRDPVAPDAGALLSGDRVGARVN